MRDEIIVGLDVGSTNVRLVVGQKSSSTPEGDIQIIGAVSVPASGMSKGTVSSIEDVTSSISAAIEKAERLIGVPLTSAWLGFNSSKIRSEVSKGVVVVSKSDGEIDEADVERAIEAAKSLVVPNNYEIIHVLPIKFTIDNQEDIKDPIGMSGMRLEVQALIILGLSNQIKNLTKSVYRTSLDIESLVLSPLAAAEAVLDNKQKDLGVVVINLGATTTSLAVYEEGSLLHSAVLPLGSDHITSDIAIGLRCPINLAERVKVELGHCQPGDFNKKDDEVDISELAKEENINDNVSIISKKYVAEIIEARVEEIFEHVDNELKKIDRSGMLPAGALLVGGGAKLSGIVELAKQILRLPVSIGEARFGQIAIDKAKSPEFLTALGLVMWGKNYLPSFSGNSIGKNINNLVGKMKGVLGKFLPQ